MGSSHRFSSTWEQRNLTPPFYRQDKRDKSKWEIMYGHWQNSSHSLGHFLLNEALKWEVSWFLTQARKNSTAFLDDEINNNPKSTHGALSLSFFWVCVCDMNTYVYLCVCVCTCVSQKSVRACGGPRLTSGIFLSHSPSRSLSQCLSGEPGAQ